MILRIGICDDEQLITQYLERMIRECLEKLEQKSIISIFLNGRDLVKGASELDVIFLDIKMPEMDGYETLRKILKLGTNCQVIVASGETDRFEEAFEMGVCRYIRKPFKKEKIEEALRKVLVYLKEKPVIELFKERKKYEIKQKDVKYIKAFNGYTVYYVDQDIMRKEISLNEAESILDDNMFFRIHKQYCVNMDYVVRGKDGKITIENLMIPVSRRRKSAFEKAYLKYCLNKEGT